MMSVLKHRWKNLRILTTYTETEKEQLLKVQNIYRAIISSEIENTPIDTHSETKLPKTDTTKLFQYIPKRINISHPLASFGNAMLTDIAEYLYERGEQLAQYSNDPTNLTCFLLANKIRQIIFEGNCSKEQQKEFKKWINFLEMLNTYDVFPDSEHTNTTQTFKALSFNLIHTFEEAIKYIAFELQRASLSDHLNSLVNFGKNSIVFTFEYLSNVLSSEKIPLNFSIINLHNRILTESLKSFSKKTVLGDILYQLAFSSHMVELCFPPIETKTNYLSVISNHQPISLNYKKPFFKENGELLEEIISLFIIKQDKEITFPKNAGICRFFLQNEELIKGYLNTLSILNILARLLTNCREAAYLAGTGGELFLSLITKEQLVFLMESLAQLTKMLLLNLNFLQDTANEAYMLHFQTSTLNNYPEWKKNFLNAKSILSTAEKALKKTNKSKNKIITGLENLKSRSEEIRQRFQFFITEVNQFSKDYTWLAPNSSIRNQSQIYSRYDSQLAKNINSSLSKMLEAIGKENPIETITDNDQIKEFSIIHQDEESKLSLENIKQSRDIHRHSSEITYFYYLTNNNSLITAAKNGDLRLWSFIDNEITCSLRIENFYSNLNNYLIKMNIDSHTSQIISLEYYDNKLIIIRKDGIYTIKISDNGALEKPARYQKNENVLYIGASRFDDFILLNMLYCNITPETLKSEIEKYKKNFINSQSSFNLLSSLTTSYQNEFDESKVRKNIIMANMSPRLEIKKLSNLLSDNFEISFAWGYSSFKSLLLSDNKFACIDNDSVKIYSLKVQSNPSISPSIKCEQTIRDNNYGMPKQIIRYGETIISSHENGIISMWKIVTGEAVQTFKVPDGLVAIHLSLFDNKFLIGAPSSSYEGRIFVWDLLAKSNSYEPLHIFKLDERISSIYIHGKQLIIAFITGIIQCCEISFHEKELKMQEVKTPEKLSIPVEEKVLEKLETLPVLINDVENNEKKSTSPTPMTKSSFFPFGKKTAPEVDQSKKASPNLNKF